MADYTIFYSWQSDAPDALNKEFIRQAIHGAKDKIKDRLKVDLDLKEADRFSVASGMKDVPGSPEVATMMFEQIGESAIFIGDVSLVGVVLKEGVETRKIPNPNVSIEEGFAAGVLGWERVVAICNDHYGTAEEQPFDTRNRRFPISYKITPQADEQTRKNIRKELVDDITNAIEVIQKYDLKRAKKARDRLDIRCLNFIQCFGHLPFFPEPAKADPTSTIPFLRELGLFHWCVVRLLDLGLLHSNMSNDGALYAYHWTYVGKKVTQLIPKLTQPGDLKPKVE